MSSSGKILIFRLGSLGDTVVALPSFHLIRRAYPDRKIFLLTNEPISGKAAPAISVLAGSGLCDEDIAYPAKTRDPKALSSLREKIQSHQFEAVVHLFTANNRGWLRSWRDCLFFRSCGIPRIIGWPSILPPRRVWSAPGILEQQSAGLVRKLSQLGYMDISDRTAWNLCLQAEEKQKASEVLDNGRLPARFIVVSLGTKSLAKDWGDENWQILFESISMAHPEIGLILIGVGDEFDRSEKLRRFWKGKSANFCGKSGPRVSAALLERANLFIGHDSGPMHLAAAVGIPVVAIFSWHNPPGEWFPGCVKWDHLKIFYPPLPSGGWQSQLRLRRSPNEGILLIKPEAVAEMCLRLIRVPA